jgi:hypothetical protein
MPMPDIHLPLGIHERECQVCTQPEPQPATLVINGVSLCNLHAGERIRDEFPEILGKLLAESLPRG